MKYKNNLIVGITTIVIIVITILLANYFTITGFAVDSSNSIEKTIQIEVLANSYLELEAQQNLISVKLFLDNGTLIEEQELEFYLDNQRLYSQNKTLFNLSEASPGTHILKTSFQGSPAQYLNPASLEKKIEILEINGAKEIKIIEKENEKTIDNKTETNLTEEINQILLETNLTLELNLTNQTLLNETNITIENISLEDFICEEFREDVLWSSGYSLLPPGSTNYQIWYPKYNCTSINVSNCFFGTLEIKTRFLYFGENNEQGEGYIQISNPDKSICNSPKQGIYSKYLAYETLQGESKKQGQYCGDNKKFRFKMWHRIWKGLQ